MSDEATDVHDYPELNLTDPQLTLRAVITGMILGGLLSLCNVYMGLKIGWGFNMSITAALLSYGFYNVTQRTMGSREWGMLENNINQTAASSAASISSAGLVAPIPAWTLITGKELGLVELILWTLSVSLVGVVVAISLRRQMLIKDALPFPGGIAAGETIKEMYSKGAEAMARVKMLIGGAVAGSATKLIVKYAAIKNIVVPGAVGTASMKNLTMALSPSPLFIAVGAIIGTRACLSMLVGAIMAWCVFGPMAIEAGWVTGTLTVDGVTTTVALSDAAWLEAKGDKGWFKELVTWLLWPGVAMMVVASLTAFSFSWRSIVSAVTGGGSAAKTEEVTDDVPRSVHIPLIAIVCVASVVMQYTMFGIGWALATFGVFLTFVLAIVAARVSGETGLTPVGAMGKVTQLTFGVLDPGNVSANLMAANVTGGAASQCADLLHDMKTGLMIGASPRQQTYGQFAGVFAGAVFGSLGYLLLVGDAAQLQTLWDDPEWAMPAVVQWKAVAELFQGGIENLPPGAVAAMVWGGVYGLLAAILEKVLPKKAAAWVPSPTAVGLAFVIPAYYSVSMAFGGILAWLLMKRYKAWSTRFMIVLAAGVIAGDSLTGVGVALSELDYALLWAKIVGG
ncbi:MAG: OPT family oligopeptide transporter [Myxococcota bacterium]